MTVLQMHTFIKGKDNREKIKENKKKKKEKRKDTREGTGRRGEDKGICMLFPKCPIFYA